jgi:KRAB domain-containing zinc finger protein
MELVHNVKIPAISACVVCGAKVRDLKRHQREAHDKIPSHRCAVCQKTFVTPGGLRVHEKKTHSQEMQTCAVCSAQVKNLAQHMVVVHGTKTIKCDVPNCPTTFVSSTHKRTHMATVHEGRRFSCELCGKDVSNLTSHRRLVHDGARNHSCPICTKGFKSSAHLRKVITIFHF